MFSFWTQFRVICQHCSAPTKKWVTSSSSSSSSSTSATGKTIGLEAFQKAPRSFLAASCQRQAKRARASTKQAPRVSHFPPSLPLSQSPLRPTEYNWPGVPFTSPVILSLFTVATLGLSKRGHRYAWASGEETSHRRCGVGRKMKTTGFLISKPSAIQVIFLPMHARSMRLSSHTRPRLRVQICPQLNPFDEFQAGATLWHRQMLSR